MNAINKNLPTWDLTDLYNDLKDPNIRRDLDDAKSRSQAFQQTYQGKLYELSGDELAAAIAEYEAISEICGKIGSFAQLKYAGDSSDAAIGQFYQFVQEEMTGISSLSLFFGLEINRIEDASLDAKYEQSEALRRYRPWLDENRAFRPHQLSDEVEQVLHERRVAGSAAWVRLFDQTMAELRFPIDGEELTMSDAANMLSSSKVEDRKKAAKSIGDVLGKNIKLLAHITNTLAKDKEIDDRLRKFPTPVSSRNLSNQVEDEVVDALNTAVKNSHADLSHRYYRLKAKWFGVDQLDYWDRNAPLPDDDDRQIDWDTARSTVLKAYGEFSPELAEVGQKFFDNPWIDVPPRAGKSSGAFAHPTVPSAHPYLLLNYHGKTRDVMTLAHELGHGVHQVLAAEQGYFLSDTPLTLAETASVFGEMLTFQSMLRAESDPKMKRIMLAGKVEDMLNTVVRQIAFFEFEKRVHEKRREGELTVDEICDIWLAVQHESLGDAIRYEDEYKYYWSYIPHFIHSPFYVYAYAFGDCLVNSLYDVYQGAEDGFQQKYLDMLKAGGTKRHQELLAPFGLDASDPAFWQRGLNMIKRMIDELEELS
ncbi:MULTISPECIES: M3 family oligoendopeptidase [Thalassospira]|uniref:Oligoendopeptidase F n=1 Tax=Thalassospira profundimaris TaxID=502049 RepID=A0A367V6L8_9PROT|nr:MULTISPECIES: M3 family oligoendopeptidase [Thalassospira]KZB70543.1 oligoendopeptidase F [Thalassospira sp. MCCC 1A01148]MBR9899783.1 M3 family oligoendopeptidase [Rhodospirillales bacterium]RCK19910.1 oligoendopeptidase F [Thalassospira profundimaris]